MASPTLSVDTLRPVLADLVSEQPSRLAVHSFLGYSQQIATAYLRRRSRSGRLRLDQFEITVEDLALDCLADLFRRDDRGAFIRLRSYAALIGWASLDDAGLEIALRRLVFSVVNEGLFRRYRESDPTVGRLIRTLKQHVKLNDRLDLRRVRTSLVVELRDADPAQADRPQMPPELLEVYLHDTLDARCHLGGTVDALADLFAQHASYAPRVVLPELAICIRNVLVRRGAAESTVRVDEDDMDDRSLRETVQAYVGQSLEEVEKEMRGLYVDRRGLAPGLYQAYFRAVGDILTAQFAEPGLPDTSFRESLNCYVGGLTSKEYRQQHQAVLEYLVNLTKKRFLQQMAPLL